MNTYEQQLNKILNPKGCGNGFGKGKTDIPKYSCNEKHLCPTHKAIQKAQIETLLMCVREEKEKTLNRERKIKTVIDMLYNLMEGCSEYHRDSDLEFATNFEKDMKKRIHILEEVSNGMYNEFKELSNLINELEKGKEQAGKK